MQSLVTPGDESLDSHTLHTNRVYPLELLLNNNYRTLCVCECVSFDVCRCFRLPDRESQQPLSDRVTDRTLPVHTFDAAVTRLIPEPQFRNWNPISVLCEEREWLLLGNGLPSLTRSSPGWT